MDEPQATPATNDDFQLLTEFLNARRGDGESFQRMRQLCDRVRNVVALEQAGVEARGELESVKSQVRQTKAQLEELHGLVGGAKTAAAVKTTIDEAESRARQLVAHAVQKADEILDTAARDARQIQAAAQARIEAARGEHDTLRQGIADAKGAIKTSIPASERVR